MDWRVLVVGFAGGTGFVLGWFRSGTPGGGAFGAAVALAALAASWVVDSRVYGLRGGGT